MERLPFIITKNSFSIDHAAGISGNKAEQWAERFHKDPYQALYDLSFLERPAFLDAAGLFLYHLAEFFLDDLSKAPGLELERDATHLVPGEERIRVLLDSVPFALGAEYIDPSWINLQYQSLLTIFQREIHDYPGKVSIYFSERNERLQVPERVFFHIVEHKDPAWPFAFLATYATRTDTGRVTHVPLRYALTEYRNEREKLLDLLSCLNKVAEVSPLISSFIQSGELFHPLRLTKEETYAILKIIPQIEEAGILCRIPNWWKKRYSNFSASIKIGDTQPSFLGLNTLLHCVPSLTVNGIPLTEAEIQSLLLQTEGLTQIKGGWIEVNHARLRELLRILQEGSEDISLRDALRMELADTERTNSLQDSPEPVITHGKWLGSLLQSLRNPAILQEQSVPKSFQGILRPYQKNGFNWLCQMDRLGFGACLADDMGLGKTIQIIAYLEKLRMDHPDASVLLIVPASLIGNWQKEVTRFAPDMPFLILHGSASTNLKELAETSSTFLTITSYRMACTIEHLKTVTWDCVILDEAQAIKNPGTLQTRYIKRMNGRMHIAMTGTPIENDLGNLWSLFDFLDKGLLGSSDEFKRYAKHLEAEPEAYADLKRMISPFLLRRVKTDKSIISDLPEKSEQVDIVELSKKQTVLYRKLISDSQQQVLESTGMQRRGLVLSLILRLKQICNHPDQYLGQTAYNPSQSGKFEMLRSLCETIYEKRERVLVFTQFRELTQALDDYLAKIFHARGGVIHGGVPVKERNAIVDRFQSEAYFPYLVISVRAGGTGLNLTNANHVIHFDRWWNPAVENQATDRAFRIGQKKNVFVHKFVSKGSVEEKIDALIESKKDLAENVIGSGGENWITELSNEELLSILTLD